MAQHRRTTRGSLIATAFAVGIWMTAGTAAAADTPPAAATGEAEHDHSHNWDFLVGRWNVHHRKLKGWFVGSTTWDEFGGTCIDWAAGDHTNVDDNVVELPGGSYRGVTLRTYDPKADQWSIWWIDSRAVTTDTAAAVQGRFENGVGTFFGDGVELGRKVKWRTRWSQITPTSVHWEQAASTDGGKTWETNWTMDFTRSGA